MPCKPLPSEDLDHVLAHTRQHWEEARGKSFFITGGTGFFGMWLLESFTHINDALELGMSATVLTRDPDAFAVKAPHLTSRGDLRFIRGDIQSFDFPEGAFEYIVHAATAASAKLNAENPLLMYDTITLGTRRVLQFAEQCGVKKLLLTSSGAVYGKQPSDMSHLPESYVGGPDPLSSSSAYAEGKRGAEHMANLHATAKGYQCKIARCFAFVGPHLPLDAHFAIGNFIANAINQEKIYINSDGSSLRSYMYTADLAYWLWSILFAGRKSHAYNVGSDLAVTINHLAQTVRCPIRPDLEVIIRKTNNSSTQQTLYIPLITKAQRDLNLDLFYNLENSIISTAKYYSIP